MLRKKELALNPNRDIHAVLDEEFARLKRKYGKVKFKTPDPAKLAAAVERGEMGPDPRVVKLIADWRQSKLEERRNQSGEAPDSRP